MTYPTSPASSARRRAHRRREEAELLGLEPRPEGHRAQRLARPEATRRRPARTRRRPGTGRRRSRRSARAAGASRSPAGGGMRSTIASSTAPTPCPVLAEMRRTSSGEPPISSARSAARLVGVGLRQVDLVDDRDDLQVVLDRQVGVRERLRLEPLRGVHQQERALARLERARDLVCEVDVPRRVDQVELVTLPGARARPAP